MRVGVFNDDRGCTLNEKKTNWTRALKEIFQRKKRMERISLNGLYA